MKKFLQKFVVLYAPFRQKIAVMFLFIAALQVLNLVTPYLTGKVIDYIVAGKTIGEALFLVGVGLFLVLSQEALGYLRGRYDVINIDYRLDQHMRHQTNEKLFSLSIGQHVSEHSGLRRNVVSRGERSFIEMGDALLYDVIPLIVEIAIVIGILFYMSAVIGAIVFVGSCLFVTAAILINRVARKDLGQLEGMHLENGRQHDEMMKNAPLILTNAQGATMTQEYDDQMERTYAFRTKFWLWYGNHGVGRSLILIFTRFTVLAVSIVLVYRGDFTPGFLLTFWAWSSTALGRVSNISRLQRRVMSLLASVERYFAFLDTEPLVNVIANPVRLEPFRGKIEFRNVTLRYPRRNIMNHGEVVEAATLLDPAIADVSFTVNPGERIAIVGASGAGKSTVVHALLRAQDPDEGQILVDGQDLRVLDLDHYRKHIGVVDQLVPLFDHTLRYNILFGLNGRRDEVTEDELSLTAEMASIDRFYHRLESGFDTILGERGVKLSGGERQRVGIARALIKQPAILIFDEATSNLDTENEDVIRRSIEKASHGRTTLIIAHRLSTIRNVDRIIVFDRGRVVEEGTHRELMERSVHYQKLIHHQVGVI